MLLGKRQKSISGKLFLEEKVTKQEFVQLRSNKKLNTINFYIHFKLTMNGTFTKRFNTF